MQSDNGNNSNGQEQPEKAYADRRVADMNLHAELYNTNHHDQSISKLVERQIVENLRFQYVQRRRECLYDANKHARLREAIIIKNELLVR
jgi:hypothetical protein